MYKIDSSTSKVSFTVIRGKNIGARGTFSNITGSIHYDKRYPGKATVNANIPVSSITTGVNVRDQDLIGSKYFNCKLYPNACLRSKQFIQKKNGKAELTGYFELHGIKKLVTINLDSAPLISIKNKKSILTATGHTVVDQTDYGLSLLPLHPDGAVRINNKIDITVTIRAVKAAPVR